MILFIFKYLFVIFILALYFLSESLINLNFISLNIGYLLFFIIFLYVVFHICNNDFELNTFSNIINQLETKIDFNNYKKLSKKKKEMLVYIEDKSFFERPNNYTIICWDYIKYRINRVNEVIIRYRNGKGKRHAINHIIHFIIYSIRQIIKQLKDIPRFLKRTIRGHSTIEMQLFRSIAVKSGYNKVFQRKISELIYTPLFFSGLKEYYKLNYKKVTSNYFKEYIIACYLHFAKVFYNKKVYKNIYDFYSLKDFNDAEFLIYILCLSGKTKKDLINYYAQLFNIDKSEINKTLKELSYKK